MSLLKLLHFADVHLGTENYGRIDPSTGLHSRLADFTAALDEVVARALQGDVDLVVFAGDAYRNRDPSPTHQREFARRIRRLSEAHVPTVLLVGNHDLPSAAGRAHSVDIFDTLGVPHVTIADRPRIYPVETQRGVVQVAALPWIVRSRMFTREELRGKSLEEINEALADVASRTILDMAASLDSSRPAILVGHVSVLGAKFGSERSLTLGQDMLLPLSVVANPAFDYVALGHIHRFQVLADRPLVAYSGSIERVDFGEEHEEKGFMLVEIVAKGETRHEFVPTRARRFVTIRVKATGEDPTAQVIAAIERANVTDAVVRVFIETDVVGDARLDLGEIRRTMRDAYYVAGITRDVDRGDHRSQIAGINVEALTPLDALKLYCERRGIPEERTRDLLEYAARLVQQEQQ